MMKFTAGANAWRKVERVMGDIRMSRKRKGNIMFRSCVTPVYMNVLEPMKQRSIKRSSRFVKKQPVKKNRRS